jgi:MFS family permease
MTTRIPARAIWALGVTQVIGYGTLYYSFSVLAPEIGREFDWPSEWVYLALTLALLAGGFMAPLAGHLADRFGAARVMAIGSVAAASTLVAAALSSNGLLYGGSLVAMEVASSFILYATAFAALVQVAGQDAQRSITHLTLIAGFASTIFWPITSMLLEHMDWRGVYLVFAALHLLLCAPLHHWLGRLPREPAVPAPSVNSSAATVSNTTTLVGRNRTIGFALMMLGFAIEGFILSAVLMQIIPLLTGLGLANDMLLITTLFGPAQVLSRLANMVLGRNLPSTRLAIIAAALPASAMVVVALSAPSLPGSILFAILFGLGSGLTSIVAGSLPLQLLGRAGYGARLGWLSSARQVASAVSPFCLALLMAGFGVTGALWVMSVLGLVATLTFAAVALIPRGDPEVAAIPLIAARTRPVRR